MVKRKTAPRLRSGYGGRWRSRIPGQPSCSQTSIFAEVEWPRTAIRLVCYWARPHEEVLLVQQKGSATSRRSVAS